MEKTSQSTKDMRKTSLNTILYNWMATLFAYQPEVYFQLDSFRRRLDDGNITPNDLHDYLLHSGLLKIAPDGSNTQKLYLRLDADMFSKARGKVWTVIIKRRGRELEFSCVDAPEATDTDRGFVH